jgi:hypothetical protein
MRYVSLARDVGLLEKIETRPTQLFFVGQTSDALLRWWDALGWRGWYGLGVEKRVKKKRGGGGPDFQFRVSISGEKAKGLR